MIYRSPKMRRLDTEHRAEGGIRAVMKRLYAEGFTHDDLAQRFGMKPRTIGYYMQRFERSDRGESTDAHSADHSGVEPIGEPVQR